jgi:UDP-2-acetamido-3-amino-2,3-dideoxy-glucuronate N-acetyltransferase
VENLESTNTREVQPEQSIVDKLIEAGGRLITIGHFCLIEEPFKHGHNNWVGNYVHIRPHVTICDRVELRDHIFIGPYVYVGENTRIYQFCNISAGTIIGKNCFIGMGVMTQNDKEIDYPCKGNWKEEAPLIGDNVRIGAGALILPRVVLADNCRIGAGAVVTRSTESGFTYIGNPARKMKND